VFFSQDFSEIIIGFTIIGKGDLDKRLEWMFAIYDQNHDGLIDGAELKTAIRAILIMTDINFKKNSPSKIDEIVNTLMKNLDKNSDSKISMDEFVQAAKSNQILRNLLCPNYL
jgi:Ca2+-binding EF-hand superfamily protein